MRFGCRENVWNDRRVASRPIFEITTHRAETYDPDTRKPEVAFGDDILVDLSRRDFTVNAMALKLPSSSWSIPSKASMTLRAQCLRTPLDPVSSFSDDPLRMFRAARFIAGLRLTPDEALLEAVKRSPSSVDRFARTHSRRIRQADHLARSRSWPVVHFANGPFRTVLAGTVCAGTRTRSGSPPQRCLGAHDCCVGKTRPDASCVLAALYHDIGKPKTEPIATAE